MVRIFSCRLRLPTTHDGRADKSGSESEIASSARTCSSNALRMSSGQGMARWLAVDVATTVWRAFQRIPSAPETTWAKHRDARPSWRTQRSNVSRSPKTDGREKSQSRWTVGVPIFRATINSCQGKPTTPQNSSTTPFRMFRHEGKYAIPEGSQSPNLISRLAENIRVSHVMGAVTIRVRPPNLRNKQREIYFMSKITICQITEACDDQN